MAEEEVRKKKEKKINGRKPAGKADYDNLVNNRSLVDAVTGCRM